MPLQSARSSKTSRGIASRRDDCQLGLLDSPYAQFVCEFSYSGSGAFRDYDFEAVPLCQVDMCGRADD